MISRQSYMLDDRHKPSLPSIQQLDVAARYFWMQEAKLKHSELHQPLEKMKIQVWFVIIISNTI